MSIANDHIGQLFSGLAPEAAQQLNAMFVEGSPAKLAGMDKPKQEAIYARAYGLYQKGRYRKALPLFTQLVVLDHLERRYVLGLAATHQMLSEHEEALTYYMAALMLQPMDPWPLLRCAECLSAQDKGEEAVEALALARQLCEAGYQPRALAHAVILEARFAARHGAR